MNQKSSSVGVNCVDGGAEAHHPPAANTVDPPHLNVNNNRNIKINNMNNNKNNLCLRRCGQGVRWAAGGGGGLSPMS